MLLGVDVGGTFTDAVLYDGHSLHTAKAPSTPADQSLGVVAAVEAVLERAGAGPADVQVFAHGMTVGTNALLEERGARTALVATSGFGDLLEIARQARPSLYRLCEAPPPPLAPTELRFEVAERTGPNGIESPLAPETFMKPPVAVLILTSSRLSGTAERAGETVIWAAVLAVMVVNSPLIKT